MPEARWHGDEWRWHRWNQAAVGPRYISVIEPAEERKPPPGAQKVPFGFARALDPPADRDPQLWEGDDA